MLVIDRFEGDWAIIEYNNKTFNLPKELLSVNAQEGDVIKLSVTVDKEKTKSQEEMNEKLMEDLFE